MMSLLKSEPSTPIRSLDELLGTAYALERAAARHYADFAQLAKQEGLTELSHLFANLAEEEQAHERSVLDWSLRQRGNPPDPALALSNLPETFDIEGLAQAASSHTATAYYLLSIAVRNEDRAFALWSYIAAHAEADEIRDAAEAMARQELQHAWLLRRARRQAYHDEGRRPRANIDNRMLTDIANIEAGLADGLKHAAMSCSGDVAAQLQQLAEESRSMAERLSGKHAIPTTVMAEDILATAERLADGYLEISDYAKDEALVSEAQGLAQRAVLRLAQLRAVKEALPR